MTKVWIKFQLYKVDKKVKKGENDCIEHKNIDTVTFSP